MTDKEIVQALRCCAKGLGHDDACENCKVGEIQDRREYIEFAAANVIEHLTAENAELRKEIEWKDMVISLAQREQAKALDAADLIDRLTAENAALREKQRWIPVTERPPEERVLVNVVWVNRVPEPYYKKIKGVPFSDTACFYRGRWYWDSPAVLDLLEEYGEDEIDLVDEAVEVTHWMPLPEATEGNNAT